MRRYLYLLAALLLFSASSKAATGDTTIVQAQYNKYLDYYNNFDTTANFPDGTKTYRNIYMTFTLGKYQCPAGTTYCGDWDYTVQIFVMTTTGDTLELGRLITPYANSSYPRTPISWKQRYVFDVTDYYSVLKNAAKVRILYSGYSGGFTADIKFAFIEGTRARDVLGIKNLWRGSWDYGKASDPIENHINAKSVTAPAGTQSSEMKVIVTGHGADNSGCSEFCQKNYQVKYNGTTQSNTLIWRNNCGSNHLYPQSGTWVYDRGNWCPGDLVQVNTHKITGLTGGTTANVDVDFDAHTASGGSQPVYTFTGTMFYYGGYNKNLDAGIVDVVSPTDHETFFRQNPTCGKPAVRVQNNGSATINSLRFEYGIVGSATVQNYTWSGTIASMDTATIALPEFAELRTAQGTGNKFYARIMQANNLTDVDAYNNEFRTNFNASPQWPDLFAVTLRTNNMGSETKWKVIDQNGTIRAQQNAGAANTTYTDTVRLNPGCYRLVVTDDGCDGLYWWANPSAGSGTLTVNRQGTSLPLNLAGYFGRDFGCGFEQQFTVIWPTSVGAVNASPAAKLAAYPNPAQDKLTISLEGIKNVQGTITVFDALGRSVYQQACNAVQSSLDLHQWSNGVYTVVFTDANENSAKLQARVVVAH